MELTAMNLVDTVVTLVSVPTLMEHVFLDAMLVIKVARVNHVSKFISRFIF